MADAQQDSGVFSRRKAILTGAGLLAAGAAGGLVTERLVDNTLAAPKENPKVPVMVHLRDANEGRFDVFFGDILVQMVDPTFAAKLAKAAATAA